MIITIIIFAVILSLLVFVHELGHFVTAIKFGVGVEEFGFGLPPRIFGIQIFRNKKTVHTIKEEINTEISISSPDDGETITTKEIITDKVVEKDEVKSTKRWRFVGGKYKSVDGEPVIYSLNWIPIGGFVKIKGEDGGDHGDATSFVSKPIWKRCLILAAGVIMNVILCMVLLAIGFGIGMPSSVEGQPEGAIITNGKIQIMEVVDGSSAKTAGLKAGDVISSVDGQNIASINNLRNYLTSKEGQTVNINISRQGQEIKSNVKVERQKDYVGIGVGLVETATVRYPWYLAIWMGIKMTFIWIYAIIFAFISIFKNLIVGAPIGVELAGPVGIAVMTGQAAKMGFVYILQFTALLSINLAIINILPFPALDGGRILFLVIEKIRRKSVKQEWENLAHNIGFILLMILVLAVTYKDVVRYGGKILGALKNVIGV
ncbi:MAG: RIP metalloprotease RseP [Patescibacteria group bacterium]|jgi:regulator of sigma E protease